MEGFQPTKFWIVIEGDKPTIDPKSGGILIFNTPASAGKTADYRRRVCKKKGLSTQIKVKAIMIISGM